jgi:hypothetical protein
MSGFLHLQYGIEKSLLYMKNPTSMQTTFTATELPTKDFKDATVMNFTNNILPIALIIFFGNVFAASISNVLRENESGMKLNLQRAGIFPWAYWLSWFMTG